MFAFGTTLITKRELSRVLETYHEGVYDSREQWSATDWKNEDVRIAEGTVRDSDLSHLLRLHSVDIDNN